MSRPPVLLVLSVLLVLCQPARAAESPALELVREAQRLAAAGQREEAVRYFQEQPWPEERRERAIVSLFHAEALRSLGLSTSSQAYFEAWRERELLGEVSVDSLPGLLIPNNLPREVRGTLRDTVVYRWVDLLAGQKTTPEDLDMGALFDGGEVPLEQLSDPGVVPLVRAVTILADHERWHLSRGNRDGALEARLERFRRLWRVRATEYTGEKASLERDLNRLLSDHRSVPWWSMGMAYLAALENDLNAPIPIIASNARQGHAAFPGSPGGQESLALLEDLRRPRYSLKAPGTDGLARVSIEVSHTTVEALWFRAWPIPVESLLSLPLDPSAAAGEPAFSWKSEMEPGGEGSPVVTYVTPPIDRPGAYVLAASLREDFSTAEDNLVIATPIVLGDMVLLARDLGGSAEVTVLSGERGEPLPGVGVELFRTRDELQHPIRERVGSRATAPDGTARFEVPGGQYAAIAHRGDQAAFVGSIRIEDQEEEEDGEDLTSALIHVDRSLYRPGQKVLFKVVVYEDEGKGRPRTVPGRSVDVWLTDGSAELEKRTVTANELGTASGEITIPAGVKPGEWAVVTSVYGYARFWVEEYRPPAFEVSLEGDTAPLTARKISLRGRARHLSGLPVTRGRVLWRAVRKHGDGWRDDVYRDEVVANGTAELEPDGTFGIELDPRPADSPRGGGDEDLRFKVSAEVTDEGGETQVGERTFRLGLFHSIEAVIIPDRGLLMAGEPASVTIRLQDMDGAGRSGEGTWALFALDTPAEALPDSYLGSWKDGPLTAGGTIRHGADGEARVELPAVLAGAYRLRYQTTGEAGETYRTFAHLIVAGPKLALPLPAFLAVDASQARPGGRVRVLAHSGFPGQTVWLETWRNGSLVSRRRLRMGTDPSLVEIPVRKEDRGGFTLKLVAVRGFQLLELRENVEVPWDDRRLEIGLTTGKETWTVKVLDGKAPVRGAEVLAYLYDSSLDAFAPHLPDDPLDLYPDTTGAQRIGAGVAALGGGWTKWGNRPDFQHPRLMLDGLGFAAPEPADLPTRRRTILVEDNITEPAPEVPPEARRAIFSETPLWLPHLRTGPGGEVSFPFTVPDSAAAWSVRLYAITRDLRAGSLEEEVMP